MSIDVRDPDCRHCHHAAEKHAHFSSATHCAVRDCPCTRYRPVSLLTQLLDWFRSRR